MRATPTGAFVFLPAGSIRALFTSGRCPLCVPRNPLTRLARSAGLIGIATLTSRLLGLARDRTYAHFFGAGDAMDAFIVASRIPNLVRDLFAEGAMSAAFVPTFTRYLTTRGKEAAWRLGSQTINALLLVTAIIVVLGILFARPLTGLYAGEFARVPGKLELTTTLTQLLFPFLTMIAVAVALMGMLNSLGRFFIPALSPAMMNCAVIVVAFFMVPLSGRPRRAADLRARCRHAARRYRAGCRAVARAPPRRVPASAGARSARPGAPGDPRADGAGDDRRRRRRRSTFS